MRESYPSDISREQFEVTKPLLESARRKTSPRRVELYEVFCAALYLLRSDCQWRTVHPHFAICNEHFEHGSLLEQALKKSGWRGPRETRAQRTTDAIDRGHAEREEHGYGELKRL